MCIEDYMLHAAMLSVDDKSEFVAFMRSTSPRKTNFKVRMTSRVWREWEKFRHIIRVNSKIHKCTKFQRYNVYSLKKWPKSYDYYIQADHYFMLQKQFCEEKGCHLIFEDYNEVYFPKLR